MKKKIILFSSIGAAILIAAIVLIICIALPKGKSYRRIKVYDYSGVVNVIRNDDNLNATKNMTLKSEDKVEIKENSKAVLKLDKDKFIMAKENTTLKLVATGKTKNSKTRILVEKGGVVVEVKEKLKESESFEIASSNSVMAIRGTQISFNVEIKDNKITTSVAVLEGNTEIMLFKNEKLSKTELHNNFKLSYTTDLSNVSTDILDLVDKGGIEAISDEVLKDSFDVIKETLTSEEIDTIVDIINTFERGDDLVNHTIKFRFKTTPIYGVDPKESIEIEEDYKELVGLKYYYSKTIYGEYSEYDETNPLEVGEWYCKIEAGNAYRSDPLKFSVIENGPVDVKLSFASDAGYMIDPKELITTDIEVSSDIKYVYSSSRNGEFKEFNPASPLGLGTWYCKVLESEDYKSDIFEFEVVKRDLEIKLDFESVYIENNVFLKATLSDLDVFFNSPLASIIDDNPGEYAPSKYKYYVSFCYGEPDDDEFYPYTEVFDYENKSSLCGSISSSYELEIYFDLENSSFPEEINIIGDGVDDFDHFEHPDHIDYSYAYVEKGSEDNISTLYATLNWFSSNIDSVVMARLYIGDDSQPTEIEAANEGDEIYSVTCPGNSYDVEFYLTNVDTDVKTDKIHVVYSNIADAAGTSISSGTASEALVTYNGNKSMNIYYNINFNGNDEFSYLTIFKYVDIDLNIQRLHIAIGTTKYVVLEDIQETSYQILFIGTMKIVDGLTYVSDSVEAPGSEINHHNITYGYMGDDGNGNRVMYSYGYFQRGKGYVLDVFDNSWNKIDTITDDDFVTDNTFEKTLVGYSKTVTKVSGMAYGIVSQDIVGEYTNELGILTDEALEYLKSQLANDGITVKGTNMHIIDCVDFQLG